MRAGGTIFSYSIVLENITILDISSQKIDQIGCLPFGLVSLSCSNNKLTKLPPFPETLTAIDCSSNKIAGTLILNDNLEILKCMNNKINYISTFTDINESNLTADEKLIITKKYKNNVNLCPKNLKELNCHSNCLTQLPKLNNGLQNLFCENYDLKKLPVLPKTLIMCDFIVNAPLRNANNQPYIIDWSGYTITLTHDLITQYNILLGK